MPGFLESVAALVAATLTAGPAAAVGVPAAPPEHVWRCVEQSPGGRQELTAAEEAAVEQARELVAALVGSIGNGDNQAVDLGLQLRSIGIAPAVTTGWRQQVHDLADVLMAVSASDPKALGVAVTLADAGFSPTPADLRVTAATAAHESSVESTPAPSSQRRGPTPRSSAGSTARQSCTSTADTSRGAPGDLQPDTGNEPGQEPAGDDADTEHGATASTSWEQQVDKVVTDLAATDDPAAKEISDRLSTADSTGSGSDGDSATDSASGGSTTGGSTASPSPSGSGSDRPDAETPDPPPRPRPTDAAGGDWKQLAGRLADALATAGDTDPVVDAVADALTQAGFTGRVRGPGDDQHAATAGNASAAGTRPAEMLPGAATEVFRADFETGDFSEWGSCQSSFVNGDCAEYRGDQEGMQILRDARRGNAARFIVNPGDVPEFGGGERAEVSENSTNILTHEGDERWYQWSMQFSKDFQNPTGEWFMVMQWHSGEGSPPLRVEVSKEGMVELGGLDGEKQAVGAVRRGEWIDYTLHVKFSGSDGFVEAWENGVPTVPLTQRSTMSSGENYFKMGIYRDEEVGDAAAEVWFDDLSIWAPDGAGATPPGAPRDSTSDEPDKSGDDGTGSTDEKDDAGSSDEKDPAESDDEGGKPQTGKSDGGGKPQPGTSDGGGKPRTGKSDEATDAPQNLGPASDESAAVWDELARCESGQRWDTSTGNGYSGGLQFDRATWKAYGGDEFAPTAAEATKEQQIAVAAKVRDDRGGYGSWPACARRLGLPR